MKGSGQAGSLHGVFREARPSPGGAVIYLSMWSVLRGGGEARWQRLHSTRGAWLVLGGIGNIIGLLSPLAVAPIRHFLPPPLPPSWLSDIAEEMRQCWPFGPRAGTNPNKTCHLCLQWHLFDWRSIFLPSLPLSSSLCIPLPCLPQRWKPERFVARSRLSAASAVCGGRLCCEGRATC